MSLWLDSVAAGSSCLVLFSFQQKENARCQNPSEKLTNRCCKMAPKITGIVWSRLCSFWSANVLVLDQTSRLFAASSGKIDLYPVYPKLVIVILLFHAEGSLVKWGKHTLCKPTLNHVELLTLTATLTLLWAVDHIQVNEGQEQNFDIILEGYKAKGWKARLKGLRLILYVTENAQQYFKYQWILKSAH